MPDGGIRPPGLETASSSSAHRFSHVRYVCQPTAMTPAKTLRYSMGTYVKFIAVTMGHSFTELTMEVGTVLLTRSHISTKLSPARKACIPKKYVLKIGVNIDWLMTILVAMEIIREL